MSWTGTLRDLLDALDYGTLAEVYCDEGGAEFWRAKRPAVEELGLLWAEALARRLEPEGSSLYAGAGVAELPAMVMEIVRLGRRVRAANLRVVECEVIGAAASATGLSDRLRVEAADAGELATAGGYDHLSAVSLLDDPETLPLLSAVTYGRVSPVHLDLDAFARERERARELVRRLVAGLATPGWVTTTFEEVDWFLERAHEAGVSVTADDEMIDTAVVGDPIGFLRVG